MYNLWATDLGAKWSSRDLFQVVWRAAVLARLRWRKDRVWAALCDRGRPGVRAPSTSERLDLRVLLINIQKTDGAVADPAQIAMGQAMGEDPGSADPGAVLPAMSVIGMNTSWTTMQAWLRPTRSRSTTKLFEASVSPAVSA